MTNQQRNQQKVIALKGLKGNPPAGELSSSQQLLAPHVDLAVGFWWVVWFAVLSTMIVKTIRRRAR